MIISWVLITKCNKVNVLTVLVLTTFTEKAMSSICSHLTIVPALWLSWCLNCITSYDAFILFSNIYSYLQFSSFEVRQFQLWIPALLLANLYELEQFIAPVLVSASLLLNEDNISHTTFLLWKLIIKLIIWCLAQCMHLKC